jgi:hypothetical protein
MLKSLKLFREHVFKYIYNLTIVSGVSEHSSLEWFGCSQLLDFLLVSCCDVYDMSHCSCYTFMIMWHKSRQMVNYVRGPCSWIAWISYDFHQLWHNHVDIFVLICTNHHFQLSYHLIVTKILQLVWDHVYKWNAHIYILK